MATSFKGIVLFLMIISSGIGVYFLLRAVNEYNGLKIERWQCAKTKDGLIAYQGKHRFKKAAFEMLSKWKLQQLFRFLGYEEPDVYSACNSPRLVESRMPNSSLLRIEEIFEEALSIRVLKPLRDSSGEVLLTWRKLSNVLKNIVSYFSEYLQENFKSLIMTYYSCLAAAAFMIIALVVVHSAASSTVEDKKSEPGEDLSIKRRLFITLVFNWVKAAITKLIMGTDQEAKSIIHNSNKYISEVTMSIVNAAEQWFGGESPNLVKFTQEQIVSGCMLMLSSLLIYIVGSPGVHSGIAYWLVSTFLFLSSTIANVYFSYLCGDPLQNGFLPTVLTKIQTQVLNFVCGLVLQVAIFIIITIISHPVGLVVIVLCVAIGSCLY